MYLFSYSVVIKSSTRGEKAEKASPSKRATKEDDENDNDDDWRLMSGFLWKLPTRTVIVSRGFQRRWFVLNKDQLLYHKTRNGKPAGGAYAWVVSCGLYMRAYGANILHCLPCCSWIAVAYVHV